MPNEPSHTPLDPLLRSARTDLDPRRRLLLRAIAAAGLAGPAASLIPACRCSTEPDAPAPSPGPDDGGAPDSSHDAAPDVADAWHPLPLEPPVIRVRIRRGHPGGESMTIGSDGQWIALATANPAYEPGFHDPLLELLPAAVLHAPITVRIRRGAWSIVDSLGFQPAIDDLPDLDVALLQSHAGDGALLALDGKLFPGSFRLVPDRLDPAIADRDEGAAPPPANAPAPHLDVVNHVPLERYLPGVLARELFQHWRPATFEAQAVAARSFACAEHQFFTGRRHFDVTDNASSQMYIGATASEPAVRAVAATRGVVLAWRDHLVPGYYSSCCGGIPARAIDAIGDNPINAMPPLDGAPRDPHCQSAPTFTWTHHRRPDRTLARLGAFAKAAEIEPLARLSRLEAIDVAERNPHGRPVSYRLRAVGPAGTVEHVLSAGRLRLAFDYPVAGLKRPKPPMWSGFVDCTLSPDDLMIAGRGHGHGVGLCQYGAESLARAGRDAFAILREYYPGVSFATIPQA